MKEFKIFDTTCDEELTVIVGQSASDNWNIISEAKQYDYWFHVKNKPSCHVILKLPSNKSCVSKQSLIYCGMLCKEGSKFAEFKNIKIIYTKVKNVTKGEEVGSVYTKKDTIIVI
jgi:predicted ribosome quality control (RQC) complex YloA/Tae2 family protein